MIDVINEALIDLTIASGEPALRNGRTGKSCSVSQVYRYAQGGARAVNGERVRLEVVKCPGGLRTSREAIARFIAALTDPDRPVTTRTAATRRRESEKASRDLARSGW